jgi:hypothetical protein
VLNPHGRPAFEAAVQMGAGVFQTLKSITHAVLVDVTKMIVVTPAATAPEPEPVAATAAATRIRAVASRERTPVQEPVPSFEAPAAEAPAPEPEPAFAEAAPEPRRAPAAAASHLHFDDVSLPPAEEPQEQPAHETPITPPWRRTERPAVRSQAEEFAEHLSTDSFGAHGTPRRPAASSAHATTDLPQRDVPRSADRHPAGRATRGRRPAETETALEPAGAPDAGEWADYTDPKSVDLQGAAPGGWEQPATGAVRVRGPVGGWDEAARRPRDPRPVVDRRKRGRRENVETLSTTGLWAGSLFSLFLLVVIGYLVHALL